MKKSMKWLGTLAFMMMCAMTFTACGSDDDEGGGKTSGAYVGEWVNIESYGDDDYYVEVLKLNSNGTGTDTWYHLCEYEAIYEVSNFTYSVSGSQITVKTSEGIVTGNYSMGISGSSQLLAVTFNGSTTTYVQMTSEIRSAINAFSPVKGDIH
ncbi:MAG: hypothetical protein IJ633_04690 [Prevotella sp.]|nr:hypothetical protein [Prevotella sp.]